MNYENRTRNKYTSAVAQLKRLPVTLGDDDVAKKAELTRIVAEMTPLVAHFNNDKKQVAAWRKDKNKFWQWLCSLVSAATTLRYHLDAQNEHITIGGEEIGRLNKKTPGRCGTQTILYLRGLKLGSVNQQNGTLYINLLKLPAGVKARVMGIIKK